MNKNIFKIGRIAGVLGGVLLLAAPLTFTSCKEDISSDAYAIKTESTMMDYVSSDSTLSDIKELFGMVKLGNSSNASTLASVLAARGNYTVFAPTNSAVRAYVLQLTGTTDLNNLTEEQKKQIALNCIIDNGTSSAYETADFPTGGNTFSTSNLRDRRLSCTQDSTDMTYVINGDSRCITTNIEVSNGYLHIVDHVISPSTNSVAELLQSADNMQIIGLLLNETAWADSLSLKTSEEEEYENAHLDNAGTTWGAGKATYMATRSVSYTAFFEPDNVLESEWGIPAPVVSPDKEITNKEEILAKVVEMCKKHFPTVDERGESAADTDYKNPANVVNRFISYHILRGGMSVDQFVHHFNEYGYDYVTITSPVKKGYSVDVWDYYQTMGKNGGLLKITQLPDGDYDYYLNRISKYNDGIKGDYKETSTKANEPGENGINIRIHALNDVDPSGTTFDNNALNGFYYPIDHVLVYNDATRKALGGERMRIDATTIFHEFISQDVRGKKCAYFPNDYFSGITNVSSSTTIAYLQDGFWTNSGWKDFQGDEIFIKGRYDFVLKLPPVPYADTYEIRMGASLNNMRGMFQVYFGDSPDRTQPIGLPIDQRESVDMIPGSPWVADGSLDEATIRENDRNLRNQGYMKSPNYFCVSGSGGKTTTRNATPSQPALRRILTTKYMEPGKSYYLRFKATIDSEDREFMLDYFEFVPTSIVNAVEPEDIW